MQICVEPSPLQGVAGWCQELDEIIGQRRLQPVFQPIVDLDAGVILGYEGLIRGPSDSTLHSPMMLFEAAERCQMTISLDIACLRACAERFTELALPGMLFVNLHPETLLVQEQRAASILAFLAQIGLDSKRVILELTETRPNGGYLALREVTSGCRKGGLRIAMDDLGEGFSNLRLWSELRPDFVKLDKHFVQNIHLDPLKEQFVRSMVDIARESGAQLVAEGIESAAELRTLCRLGVRYGQGYLLARPQAHPAHELPLSADSLPWTGNRRHALRNQALARDLLMDVAPMESRVPNEAAYRRFAEHPECFAIPVVEDGVPVGLLRRHHLLESFAKPFNRELYGKKPCHLMMDKQPLVVNADITVHELSSLVVAAEQRYLVDGFIITEGGRYLGMGTGFALMRKITELQLSAARYANPLTGLPGNVPINETVDRLLGMRAPFVAAYADLDHFKPFNDLYGYAAGDDLILLLARLLQEFADPERDFVGHVGGDDFVVLMQSEDWEERLRRALAEFGRLASGHFTERHREAGGFEVAARTGEILFLPLTTLSLGVVKIQPGRYLNHHEIGAATADAKKQAKKMPGNSLFIERRVPPSSKSSACACGR
ncbi:phosphodiesterase [Chromobacterium sp. IIBBL 290-4]|uniref:phosphodiesterase n=1 Tax=Chromobacterium sp. IIBBL 290-4 TaxID=2953890 RepID=UPI0020B8E682|nr:phosphodiesterase [Chromobacterium sp. IIBBL 290-4]UTH74751.1 phosphodiesterase [Chromobacterium sp. IIBBL 290-4]